MKIRRLFFWLGLAFSCRYIFDNIVWIHPFPPSVFSIIVGILFSVITVWTATSTKTRVFGACVVLAVILVTLFHIIAWRNFDRSSNSYAEFLSSIETVSIKINTYCKLHPNVTFTNLSDYIGAGVLSSTDRDFLYRTSAILLPQTARHDRLLEVRQGTNWFIISSYGDLYVSNSAASNDGNQ
jgi:hypothetical protein